MSTARSTVVGLAAAALAVSAIAAPKPKEQPQFPPPAATSAVPQPTAADADLAFGAFQRGYYLTAFAEAIKRVEANSDVKSMTLLGELYADGLGVPRNDQQAATWYQLAADRGDRNAMFALATFRM